MVYPNSLTECDAIVFFLSALLTFDTRNSQILPDSTRCGQQSMGVSDLIVDGRVVGLRCKDENMQIRPSHFIPQMRPVSSSVDHRSAFVSRIPSCLCPNMTHPCWLECKCLSPRSHLLVPRLLSFVPRFHSFVPLLAIFTVRFVIPHMHYSHGNGRLISTREQTPSSYEIENRLCRV